MQDDTNRLIDQARAQRAERGAYPEEVITALAETLGLPEHEVLAGLDHPGVRFDADFRDSEGKGPERKTRRKRPPS